MFRIILAVVALACGSAFAADVSVFAAASLTDALKEIGTNYSAENGDHVSFNFAASNLLARQIEEDAPADLFVSADEAQMDRLEKNGRIEPGSRRDLLANSLVIVALAESTLTLNSAADLRKVARIAVGDPKYVPVGVYTRAYLEKAGLWRDLESKILPAENVRAGLAVVESGNANVAFVYASDVVVSKKVKVLYRVPPNECPPIRYPGALVKQSKPNASAAKFLAYLTTPPATAVFEKFGFAFSP